MIPVFLDLNAPLGQYQIQDTKKKKKRPKIHIRFASYEHLETYIYTLIVSLKQNAFTSEYNWETELKVEFYRGTFYIENTLNKQAV